MMKGIRNIFPLVSKADKKKDDESKIVFLAQERVTMELRHAAELFRVEAKDIARCAVFEENPQIAKHLLAVAVNSMEVADLLDGVNENARTTFVLNNEVRNLVEPYLEDECEEDI